VARIFSELVAENEEMYPDIRRWLKTRVLPGIQDDSRTAFVALSGPRPVAAGVVKRGSRAKFCHLRVAEEFRDKNLGEVLFVFMAFAVHNWAHEVHFTLPEGVWENEQRFFRSFGFSRVSQSGIQYRPSQKELVCSAPFSVVWSRALQKLPKLRRLFSVRHRSSPPSIVLSVKPRFADRIMSGEKTVELRTRFSQRWIGHRVSIYASGVVKGLVGEATVRQVDAGEPNVIWLRYSCNVGCTQQEFLEYVGPRTWVYAIELADVTPYPAPIPIAEIEGLSKQTLTPPQSYARSGDDDPWGRALSIAAFLQARSRPAEAGNITP
jgi:predicted transcriptional regulator